MFSLYRVIPESSQVQLPADNPGPGPVPVSSPLAASAACRLSDPPDPATTMLFVAVLMRHLFLRECVAAHTLRSMLRAPCACRISLIPFAGEA